jgi:dihydroorotase (multifunctional complex type)
MRRVDVVVTEGQIYLPGGSSLDGWVAIKDGRVAAVGEGTTPSAPKYLSANGKLVLPGLIDIHIHFRDPGFTYKEDFLSGSSAAAFGGVTTVVDMPNTEGWVVSPEDLRRKLDILRGRSFVDYGLYALLKDSEPHIKGLKELGVAGLKWLIGYDVTADDNFSVRPSSNVELFKGLRLAAAEDVLVGVHAEFFYWLRDLGKHEQGIGRNDPLAPGQSRPPFVEALGVAEASIALTEVGGRLHIHHLSSAAALKMAISMKQSIGTNLTIETCPQYLFLTENDVEKHGPIAICNPPIRRQEDVDALWCGIARGEIDCIATDHAPHAEEEKYTSNIWDVKPGLLGVETLFPLTFNEVSTGRLSLQRFVELTAETPASIVGMDHRKGRLWPGHDADLIIVDPDAVTRIEASGLHSKHAFTPYEGRECKGEIVDVMVRGNHVASQGQLISPPIGEYIPRRYSRHQRAVA